MIRMKPHYRRCAILFATRKKSPHVLDSVLAFCTRLDKLTKVARIAEYFCKSLAMIRMTCKFPSKNTHSESSKQRRRAETSRYWQSADAGHCACPAALICNQDYLIFPAPC